MNGKKINSAEKMKEIALAYLSDHYDDHFSALGYSSSNWAYKYSSIRFMSQKFSEPFEVHVYKNDDETYSFEDNYFHLYMMPDAISFFQSLADEIGVYTVRVRFPYALWSDGSDLYSNFKKLKNNGKCETDVFYITNIVLTDIQMKNIASKIASENITGSVYFLVTNDSELLVSYTLHDILNDMGTLVTSTYEYHIDFDHKIKDKGWR